MFRARVLSGGMGSPKEGRSNRGLPGLPSPGSPRGVIRHKHRAVWIAVTLCMFLCLYLINVRVHTSSDALSPPDGKVRHPPVPKARVMTESESKGEQDESSTTGGRAEALVDEHAQVRLSAQRPDDDDDEKDAEKNGLYNSRVTFQKPVPSPGDKPAHQHADPDAKNKLFGEHIRALIRSLPGEIHTRDYLRAVEGTGKEKLRELGLRARAFKEFFDTWERVHMSQDAEGIAVLRDDVVAYLKRTTAQEATLGDSDRNETDDDDDTNSLNALAGSVRAYETYRSFMAKFTKLLFPYYAPYFPDLLQLKSSFAKGGRGIVLTAGDHQAPYLLTTIPSFRALGCDLPIEVMYLGESDLSDDYRAELEALPGVITRDIAQMVDDQGWRLAGWAAKPFAMLLSSFREVMFIDADSAFFRNPAELFDDAGFRRTGALFFRDRIIMPENKKRWLQQILPQPVSKGVRQSRMWTGESGHYQESGVVVVDKWRHFVSMLLVTLMNGPERDKREGSVGVYDMMYGDKETFWVGFELAGDTAYSWHQGVAGGMGVVKPAPASLNATDGSPKKHTMCMPQLVHFDAEGKPLWFNGWLLHNKYVDKSERKFANFKEYLLEPEGRRDVAPWSLGEANSACLTSEAHRLHQLDSKDVELLDSLKVQARKVGAAPAGES